jgi:transposase
VDVPEAERLCPCCHEPMQRIGEDRSERVDYRPAKIVVKVLVRPKYACTKKHGSIRQAPLPVSPVPGGRFDFGLVAQVVTSKLCDHLPLYRQQDVLARSGLELSRSTLCEILSGAAFLLEPLATLAKRRLLTDDILGADDTPVRLLDPGHPQGVRLARFWLYRGSEAAPYNVFDFHESRSRDGPRKFLGDYQGWLKVDAYGVDDGVYLGNSRLRASCCVAHARRKFEEALASYPQLAAEALAYFRQLYDIEDRASQLSPDARQALRQAEAVPLLERLRSWKEAQAETALPKSTLGKAVGYLRNQWEPLTTYVLDGRLPIDNNATERDLRP